MPALVGLEGDKGHACCYAQEGGWVGVIGDPEVDQYTRAEGCEDGWVYLCQVKGCAPILRRVGGWVLVGSSPEVDQCTQKGGGCVSAK